MNAGSDNRSGAPPDPSAVPRESRSAEVLLTGGPLDGQKVPVPGTAGLLVEVPGTPGHVARYRRTRDRGVYRFKEYDTVVLEVKR